MKSGNPISNKERKLLLIVTFFTFILAFSSFVSDSIKTYNEKTQEKQEELERKANSDPNEPSFCVYGDWGDDRPLFRFSFLFLTLFTILFLRKANKYLFSTFFTGSIFCIFVKWFAEMIRALYTNESIPDHLTDRIFLIANLFDYIVFLFISIIFFWQISILFRIFNKSQQCKNVMP